MSHEHDLDTRDQELADQLIGQRPVPGAGFRGSLRRHLEAADPGYGSRPAALRATVALWLAAGFTILVLGYLQAVGVF